MVINVVSVGVSSLYTKEYFSTAYETMSCAILTPNFPTHVPPYFCTSHLASGFIVFWCRFGGVLGGEGDDEDSDSDVDIKRVVCIT